MSEIRNLIGKEADLPRVARAIRLCAEDIGVPATGGYHITCSDESEWECAEVFDRLFTQSTGWAQLDEALGAMHAKREYLLLVLEHPEIPLHNNLSENVGMYFTQPATSCSMWGCERRLPPHTPGTGTTLLQRRSVQAVPVCSSLAGGFRLPSLRRLGARTMTSPGTREELIEVMAQALCVQDGTGWAAKYSADIMSELRANYTADAEAILKAIEAANCTVVPNEATADMVEAGVVLDTLDSHCAMTAASPFKPKKG